MHCKINFKGKIMDNTELARWLDFTLVTNMNTLGEIDELISAAKKYHCACVFVMPSYLEYVVKELSGYPDVNVGGVMGFPYGMDFTEIKAAQTRMNIALGADDLDMVMNLGLLLSGKYERVKDDIKACVDASQGIPIKCIIETPLLSDEYIGRASEIAADAGAAFIKTSTGFFGPTKVEHIKSIKRAVGDDVFIKAAGGIRTIETINEFIAAGASRLGIGLKSALNILENNGEVSEDY